MRIVKGDGTVEHKCKSYRGKIKDVSYRPSDDSIRCRACGGKLTFEEVDSNVLIKIIPKINNNSRRKREFKK